MTDEHWGLIVGYKSPTSRKEREKWGTRRNLVGHMNFPNAYDRNAIDGAYRQLPNLVARLSGQNIPIAIP